MVEKKKKLPIGHSDFKRIIEDNFYFVDKSLFIKELIDSTAAVTLIPRPRRFGKTLNLSMLRYFFEKTDVSHASLFANLKVAAYPDIMAKQGQYPVIFITFKDVKQSSWPATLTKIKMLVADEFRRHRYLLESKALDDEQKIKFKKILSEDADQEFYTNSLKELSGHLCRYHQRKVVILIDEYDEPINAGFTNKFYRNVIDFMRGFLCGGLKDNVSLEQGVVTGISRISKESIFSGINNLEVCTNVSSAYADKFGWIEGEVKEILAYYQLDHGMDTVRAWYNGYASWNLKVYNPWSIIKLAKEGGLLKSYWVNTSDNMLVKNFVQQGDHETKEALRVLLTGQPVKGVPIIENIVFPTMESNRDMLLNFLLSAGYVTYSSLQVTYAGKEPEVIEPSTTALHVQSGSVSGRRRGTIKTETMVADMTIPNKEVFDFFKGAVREWFTQGGTAMFNIMVHALINGNVDDFAEAFQGIVMHNLGLFDLSGNEPERFYHGFTVGMFVNLQVTHTVKSNYEAGTGRCDLLIIPNDKKMPGIVIEFKKVRKTKKETLEAAAALALKQLEERHYAEELRALGVARVIKLGISFLGKETLVVEGK